MLKYVYLISYYISTYSSDFMSDGLPLPLTLSHDQWEDTVMNESRLRLVRGSHDRDWNFNKELEDRWTEMMPICLPAVNNSWGGQRAGVY